MSSSGDTPDNMAASGETLFDLSVPQTRALVLRDELKWTDHEGVHKLIEGISSTEPPRYQRINGVVQPPLVMVTLKEKATRFPLGNVYFDGNANLAKGIYIAYLTLENGVIQIRFEGAAPFVNGGYDPVPIHSFVAHNMVGLFQAKFLAASARRDQINAIRQVAFDMASQQPVEEEFRQGETFSKLDLGQVTHSGSSSKSKKAKKRKPGDPVIKHATNTREQLGLQSIPQEAKTATFNAISANIKVDFFNNVIRTAFPNFDNLMIASWNVVSIYSNVGTDFPELHKSIVELKSVLQDFEGSFGPVSRRDPKIRRDFAPNDDSIGDDHEEEEDDSRAEQPEPDVTQDELKDSSLPPSGPSPSSSRPQDQNVVDQEQDDHDSLFNDAEPDDSTEMPPPPPPQDDSAQMPPPRLTPRQQVSNTTPTQPIRSNSAVRSSPKVSTPTLEKSSSRVPSPSTTATGSPNPRKRPRNSSASSQERATIAHSPKLHRKRDDQISSPQTPSSSLAVQPLSSPSSSNLLPTPEGFTANDNDNASLASLPNASDAESNDDEDDAIPPTAPNPTTSPSRLSTMSSADLRTLYNTRRDELVNMYGSLEQVPAMYRKQMKDIADAVRGRKVEKKGKKGRGVEDTEEEEVMGSGNGNGGSTGTAGGKEMPKYLGNSVLGGKKGMGMAPVAPMMWGRREGGNGGGGGARKGGE